MHTQPQLLDMVNAALSSLRYNPRPDDLYAPVRYALSLGGKRIRPVLMLMAYDLYRDDVEAILPNALALETYHNFTLLHDDIMDRADVRRGKPCVHKVWGDNAAILSGDAMLVLSYRLMTERRSADAEEAFSQRAGAAVPEARSLAALRTFTEATLGVCEGQQYDVDFERRNDVTEEEYMEMIRLKTSLLVACALKIGAQLAGAPDADCRLLYRFGEQMGLAFQLQDDLLDVYGDTAEFGKKIGGDIVCNKKTFMLINALRLASPQQRAELEDWMGRTDFDPDEKVAAVRAVYDDINIRAVCGRKIEALFAQSLQALDGVDVPDERKAVLREFAHRLMGRKS